MSPLEINDLPEEFLLGNNNHNKRVLRSLIFLTDASGYNTFILLFTSNKNRGYTYILIQIAFREIWKVFL